MAYLKFEIDTKKGESLDLSGDLVETASMWCRGIQLTYSRLNQNPQVGKAFRALIVAGIMDPDSLAWADEGPAVKRGVDFCAIVPGKERPE